MAGPASYDEKYTKSKLGASASEQVDTSHSFADHTDRFPNDQRLRKCGWKIHARPKGKEALWSKDGVILPFSIVLGRIPSISLDLDNDCKGKR